MKLIRKFVILVIALAVGLYFLRNFIVRKAMEVATEKMTGFTLGIESVDIGLISGAVEVRNLKLMNPPEFHGGMFANLPLVRVNYNTMSFLRRSPHIKELIVNVAEIDLVKNEKGENNATVLQNKVEAVTRGGKSSSDTGSGSGSPSPGGTPSTEEKKMPYRVDLVKIHVGTVVQRSYGRDGKPREHTLNLNVDATYKDIVESTNITKLVMDTVMDQLGPQLTGNVIKGLGNAGKNIGDTLQKSGKGILDMFK